MSKVEVYKKYDSSFLENDFSLWEGDSLELLKNLPHEGLFDLVVTSPPYNIGKEYEENLSLNDYFEKQEELIINFSSKVKESGHVCWQVGNYIRPDGSIYPLDLGFNPIFEKLGFKLRNRIVWKFGHGLHASKRFSGRHEVIMWYSKSDNYKWDLDAVRIPQKYPGKRHFKGPNKGAPSGNRLGKNPEDVWDIPNVKANHVEKTIHPCQFPIALIERLIKSMTAKGDVIFDPYAGVGSSGVAAALNGRKFYGGDTESEYIKVAKQRLMRAIKGQEPYRPDTPVYEPKASKVSSIPEEWQDE